MRQPYDCLDGDCVVALRVCRCGLVKTKLEYMSVFGFVCVLLTINVPG